jgi:hypothetical protein
MNNVLATRLLFMSYQLSAKRVLDALDGVFSVANSRQRMQPTMSLGEVVGICGQGGRHPFFRLDMTALRAAAKGIVSL